MTETLQTKILLNVGCGGKGSLVPPWFPKPLWREIRLDIDPAVEPDIVSSTTDMRAAVASESVDAVWSAHNIEHLFAHEVDMALKEFARVIKPDGIVVVYVPNLQRAAELVAQDKLDETAYSSGVGPISPLDMLYGLRTDIAAGRTYMAHKTGFTATTLRRALANAGLCHADVKKDGWDLLAVAAKQAFGTITLGTNRPPSKS